MNDRYPSDLEVEKVLERYLRLVGTDESGHIVGGAARHTYAVLGPVPLPITLANGQPILFQWTTFARLRGDQLGEFTAGGELQANTRGAKMRLLQLLGEGRGEWPQSILTLGDFERADRPLVRIHSNCATGDVFGSRRCECGPQLRAAFEEVAAAGVGGVIYLADHEGRGIGLFAKAAAYLLQDRGMDTYEANRHLGFEDDDRDFQDAAFILNHLRGEGRAVRLLSNNPEKMRAMTAVGIKVAEMVPLVTGLTRSNMRYMRSKRAAGHILPEDLLNLDLSALSRTAL